MEKIITTVNGNQLFIQRTEYTTDRVVGKNGIYRVIWKCLPWHDWGCVSKSTLA